MNYPYLPGTQWPFSGFTTTDINMTDSENEMAISVSKKRFSSKSPRQTPGKGSYFFSTKIINCLRIRLKVSLRIKDCVFFV